MTGREWKTLQAQAKILQISDEDLSNKNSKMSVVVTYWSNQRFKILTFCCNQYIDNNNSILNAV